MDTLRTLQGYSIHFVHDGKDWYINPETWTEEKAAKLYEMAGLLSVYIDGSPVFYNPEHWKYNQNIGFVLKGVIDRPTQIYNLQDYSMLFRGYGGDAIDLSHWDMRGVVNMDSMFSESSLYAIDLGTWSVGNVRYANDMFASCKNLLSVNMDHVRFTQLRCMDGMFNECSRLYNFSAKDAVFGSVVTAERMFDKCGRLRECDLGSADFAKLESVDGMFKGCDMLNHVSLPANAKFIKTAGSMFSGCTSLVGVSSRDLLWPDCYDMSNMFQGCRNIELLKLPRTVEECLLPETFVDCVKLKTIDMSGIKEIKDVTRVFGNCISLRSVNVRDCSLTNDALCDEAFKGSGLFSRDVLKCYGDEQVFRALIKHQNKVISA